MYVAEAQRLKLTNPSTASPSTFTRSVCASSIGTKISTFFAHWCSRIAFRISPHRRGSLVEFPLHR